MESHLPQCIGIIPARYASQRFPGKPLVEILGRPMFWHVYQRASQCPQLDRVLLATDDERIRQSAQAFKIPVVMTSVAHPSGSDRILEAAQAIGAAENSVIVNIQGDEPALDPAMIGELLIPFKQQATQVTTLAHRIDGRAAVDPNIVKVVFTLNGNALYFSRAVIPHRSTQAPRPNYYGHIGLYAYRKNVLEKFVQWGPSPLEQIEKLEQLRLLENGVPIQVVITNHVSRGVDVPEDLEAITKLMAKQPNASDSDQI